MLGRQISSRIKLFLHFLPIKKSKEKSADNVNLIESWREILLVMSWGEGGGGESKLRYKKVRQVAHAVLCDDRRILNPVEIRSSTLLNKQRGGSW